MRRRDVLTAALLVAPFRMASAAERVIGWISPETPERAAPFFAAFRDGLAAQMAGSAAPVRIVDRFEGGNPAVIAGYVAELQRLGARLIVAHGAATLPVVRAQPQVPVVFGFSGDPVVAGIARSLARPGGNATGMSFMSVEINPKRIELVRMILPACRHVALLSNARHPGEENEIAACRDAVAPLGIELSVHRFQSTAEALAALTHALDGGAEAVIALPSASRVQQTPVLVASCMQKRVPLISGWSEMARAGALLTYGPNLRESYKRIAWYAIRILDGASASDLPIEQPTTFELVVNLKSASALGLEIPSALLTRADDVIR